ncbi:MAG: FAD-binding oxidoreductase [Alphaproteobacteria bacterium]
MPDVRLLPSDDATNGWSRILPRREPRPPLTGDVRADWAVVGAGFAGLAAARRLARNRPNDRVVLLEAQEVGEGASGRNSGFAIDLPHNVGSSLDELEGSRRTMKLSRAAIEILEASVTSAGIACQWSRRGKYHAAVSPWGRARILEPFARELEALGEPYRWLDRDALTRELGTPYYHAAVHTPGCVLMNPAALNRGLAECLPDNVTLHERAPVVRWSHDNGVRLETPKGSVFAPTLIIATNGLADQFGAFRGKLLRFAAHASLTRPLTEAEWRALGGVEEWGLTPANAFAGATMRLTQDRRILIRQRITYAPSLRRSDADRSAARRLHQAAFRRRFPMLPAVTMEHTWTGFVCLSRNTAPGFGKVGPGMYAAVCQNAVGVTKGTIAGTLVADMASGQDNPMIADMEALGTPAALPPRPFLDIGVEARFALDLWRAHAER